jgi:hypothetical protein
MFTRHVSRQLAAYIDGQLTQLKAQQTEHHLQECSRCRAEFEQVREGMAVLEHLPVIEAPARIWSSIETAFQGKRSPQSSAALGWRWAFVAIVAFAVGLAAYWGVAHRSGARWEVVRLYGAPFVDAKPISSVGRIGAGEWIETDGKSQARVEVGAIGSVDIAPNTRIRVVTMRPREHRLALARGEIRAKISAPPKLFFVDTGSGTAVDLGCEYELKTDEDGSGLLRVTKGWVSFQWKGIESLVPAGASCRTRPKTGPGIPFFDDAPEGVKRAVEVFGFEKTGIDALNVILSESRVRDTLTLWHLLSRVPVEDRGRVFDRIAALTPAPAGVSREQVLKLDPPTLERWKEELAWTW